MRARTSRGVALLAALAALVASGLSATGAGADHSVAPNDDRQWIAQGDPGSGTTQIPEQAGLPVLEDMNVQTVLFNPERFTYQNGFARPGFGRYVAWGLVRVQPPELNTVVSQLAISHSENGLTWTEPRPATIRDPKCDPDPGCPDIPFILNEPGGFFDVVFTNTPVSEDFPFSQFQIFYRPWNADIFDADEVIHVAWSDDGQSFYGDRSIGQNAAEPVTTGSCCASFKSASYGPTDVIYQPNASSSSSCATADPDGSGPLTPTPWNCRLVMIYDATDGAKQQVGIASAPDILPPYTQSFTAYEFRGHAEPLLANGPAGAWDDDAATLAKVRIRPGATSPLSSSRLYDLYYAGGQAPDGACFAGQQGCWSLGTAISSGSGLSFVKTGGNPVTPHELLEVFGPDDPHTLLAPSVLEDAGQDGNGGRGHARIYYTRATNGVGGNLDSVSRDMFLAYTEPAPTQAPRIRIASPVGPFRNRPDVPLEFYMTDTLGTNIGVDLNTLVVKMDGTELPGGWSILDPHLVTALKFPSIKAAAPSGLTILPDGLHTFTVEVADLDGNVGIASTAFIIDTTAPSTTVTSAPEDGHLGFPIAHPGTFMGETIESAIGTALERLDVFVTNPLGQRATYQVQIQPEMVVDEKTWHWTWHAPTPDPFFFLPGNYTFSFRAADVAQNRESATADNTISVLII